MKAKLISIMCILLASLGIQAQTAEFETATEAVKNMKVGINWGMCEGTDADWSNWTWGGPGFAENIKMNRKLGFGAVRFPLHGSHTWMQMVK